MSSHTTTAINFQRAFNTFLLAGLCATILQAALYLRPGPFGLPYVLDTWHYLPHAIFYEWFGASIVCLPFVLLAVLCDRRSWTGVGRGLWIFQLALLTSALVVGHADHEIQRFMGVHLSIEFLQTYGAIDNQPEAVSVALSSDPGGAYSALWLAGIPALFAAASIWLGCVHARPWPRNSLARRSLLIAAAALTFVWPFITWNFVPGGVLRRSKIAPAVVLVYREIGQLLAEKPRDYSDISRHLRFAVDRWRQGDPRGEWSFPDPRYPLRKHRALPCPAPLGEARPNFVVISLETFRAKDMKSFNPKLDAQPTPFLDRLAKDPLSAYWPRFYANALPTVYAFMALHTSLLPHSQKRVATSFGTVQLDAFPALLRRHGYRTAYFTGSDPDWDSQRLWLNRWYDQIRFDPEDHERDRLVFAKAAAALKELGRGERPFLMSIFSISNHYPFNPPEARFAAPANASVFEQLHGTMRYTDDVVRELFATLQHEPFFERTVFFILGDHAYDIGDRGVSGGHDNLRHESTWVPLIVHGALAGLPRGRQAAVASQIDLAPTIMALAGICDDNSFYGHSLLGRQEHLAEAFSLRSDNAAIETANWSIFWQGVSSSNPKTFIYAASDATQEREVAGPGAAEEAELRGAAKSLSLATDYVYDRNAVAPPAM